MNQNNNLSDSITVLVAEDDEDDRVLIERACRAVDFPGKLHFVHDGEQLMNYLLQRAEYAEAGKFPRPSLILLDLVMPHKNGQKALSEIRQNPDLRNLPVIVLTALDAQRHKKYCTQLGVSDYIRKPSSFFELIAIMKKIKGLYLP